MAILRKLNLDHLIGEQVGTSVLLKKLDQGSMSVVFVAYHLRDCLSDYARKEDEAEEGS